MSLVPGKLYKPKSILYFIKNNQYIDLDTNIILMFIKQEIQIGCVSGSIYEYHLYFLSENGIISKISSFNNTKFLSEFIEIK